ncbi:MAG TPA: type II secretion system F family protein [Burkholderiaceae bacterium]|nr:type II secretion system F family protein [Burkholderiaceae bacterium]
MAWLELAGDPIVVLLAVFVAAAAAFVALVAIVRHLSLRHRERFERTIDRSLRNAFLFIDPSSLHRLMLAAAAVLSLATWLVTGSVVAALAAALAAGTVPRLLLARMRRRQVEAFRQQLPDVLMLISGALRAGNGLSQALAGASAELPAPARNELELMLREQRLGATLAESLVSLQRRLRLEETALFASALRIGTEAGGNVADALESLADATRRKLAIEGKVHALTAQGRLQAAVMGLLPSALAAVLWAFDPDAMRPLVADWRGWTVCLAVAVAQLAGYLMIRRLVAIEI